MFSCSNYIVFHVHMEKEKEIHKKIKEKEKTYHENFIKF